MKKPNRKAKKKLKKKFETYLIENKETDEIKNARKNLAKKHKIDPKFLEFAFIWDLKKFGKTINFNVIDPKHIKYKSTVAEKI